MFAPLKQIRLSDWSDLGTAGEGGATRVWFERSAGHSSLDVFLSLLISKTFLRSIAVNFCAVIIRLSQVGHWSLFMMCCAVIGDFTCAWSDSWCLVCRVVPFFFAVFLGKRLDEFSRLERGLVDVAALLHVAAARSSMTAATEADPAENGPPSASAQSNRALQNTARSSRKAACPRPSRPACPLGVAIGPRHSNSRARAASRSRDPSGVWCASTAPFP